MANTTVQGVVILSISTGLAVKFLAWSSRRNGGEARVDWSAIVVWASVLASGCAFWFGVVRLVSR